VCCALSIAGYFLALGGLPGFFTTYARYVWPSSLLFVPSLQSHPLLLLCVLIASVAINALMYGCLFVGIRIVIHKLCTWRSHV
jgi:hypothetical protein